MQFRAFQPDHTRRLGNSVLPTTRCSGGCVNHSTMCSGILALRGRALCLPLEPPIIHSTRPSLPLQHPVINPARPPCRWNLPSSIQLAAPLPLEPPVVHPARPPCHWNLLSSVQCLRPGLLASGPHGRPVGPPAGLRGGHLRPCVPPPQRKPLRRRCAQPRILSHPGEAPATAGCSAVQLSNPTEAPARAIRPPPHPCIPTSQRKSPRR